MVVVEGGGWGRVRGGGGDLRDNKGNLADVHGLPDRLILQQVLEVRPRLCC